MCVCVPLSEMISKMEQNASYRFNIEIERLSVNENGEFLSEFDMFRQRSKRYVAERSVHERQ